MGKAYQIKISDFGTDSEIYATDYYKVDANTSLPIRWMAWESVFLVRSDLIRFSTWQSVVSGNSILLLE